MAKAKKADGWQNRIVEFRPEVPVSELIKNPLNARQHPGNQRRALASSLRRIGWVDVVKVNIRTGRMYDGHARVDEAMLKGPDTPVPVLYSDLSEDEEREVLATLDPIGALATIDPEIMNALTAGLDLGDDLTEMLDNLMEGYDFDPLGGDGDAGADDNPYTAKVESPVYEIKGPKPPVSDLVDRTKADALIDAINSRSDLPLDVRRFLLDAAERHVVFRYDRIAEFYAHSPTEVQQLMEDSVLVIVDFQRAIELGFVRMTDEIAAQFLADHGEEE